MISWLYETECQYSQTQWLVYLLHPLCGMTLFPCVLVFYVQAVSVALNTNNPVSVSPF